jgi:hypothetical protein
MVGSAETTQGVYFPKGAPTEKGFVALGCKCSCDACGCLFFKSLDSVNKHIVAQRTREPRVKRARLSKDACLCATTRILDIPRDYSEKEQMLREHCFFYTCTKYGRGLAPSYSRGMSLAEVEVSTTSLELEVGGHELVFPGAASWQSAVLWHGYEAGGLP